MSFPESIRKLVFKRDNGTCQKCGKHWNDDWMLHVAHYKHPFEGGDNSPENGRLLCVDCHQKDHELAFKATTNIKYKKAHAYAIRKLRDTDRRNYNFYKKKKT